MLVGGRISSLEEPVAQAPPTSPSKAEPNDLTPGKRAPWKSLRTFEELQREMIRFLQAKHAVNPWSYGAVDPETTPLLQDLIKINELGVVSINGQPGTFSYPSTNGHPPGWKLSETAEIQHGYLEGFVSRARWEHLLPHLRGSPGICVGAYDYALKQGFIEHLPISRDVYVRPDKDMLVYNLTRFVRTIDGGRTEMGSREFTTFFVGDLSGTAENALRSITSRALVDDLRRRCVYVHFVHNAVGSMDAPQAGLGLEAKLVSLLIEVHAGRAPVAKAPPSSKESSGGPMAEFDDAGSIGGGGYALEQLLGGAYDEPFEGGEYSDSDELEGGEDFLEGGGRRRRSSSRRRRRSQVRGGLRKDYEVSIRGPERMLADLQDQVVELKRVIDSGGSGYRMVRSLDELKNTIVVRDCPIGTIPCPLDEVGLGCPIPEGEDMVFVTADGGVICANESVTARRILGRDLAPGEKLTLGQVTGKIVEDLWGAFRDLGDSNPRLLREIIDQLRAKTTKIGPRPPSGPRPPPGPPPSSSRSGVSPPTTSSVGSSTTPYGPTTGYIPSGNGAPLGRMPMMTGWSQSAALAAAAPAHSSRVEDEDARFQDAEEN